LFLLLINLNIVPPNIFGKMMVSLYVI